MKRTGAWVIAAVAAMGVFAGLCSAVRAAESTSSVTSLEARVKRQEDIEAIRTVLREYGRRLDAGDLKAYAELFAADGEWIGGFGKVQGRDNIQPFMEKNMRTPLPSVDGAAATAPPRPGPRGVHLMTNEIIDVQGDRATAWSRWTYVTRSADNKPAMALAGHYDDEFVRENGQWKFLRRTVSGDIPYSEHPQDGKPTIAR
jgi:3-phenylpropionate/cinnamic acid dioxygenase small subunit